MLRSEMLADLSRAGRKGNAAYVVATYEHSSMEVNGEIDP
jgi:hypothetical protein